MQKMSNRKRLEACDDTSRNGYLKKTKKHSDRIKTIKRRINSPAKVCSSSGFSLQVSPEVTHQVKVMEKEALMDIEVVQLGEWVE